MSPLSNSENPSLMSARPAVPPRRPGAIAFTFLVITALVGTLIGALAGWALLGLVGGLGVAVAGIAGAYRRGISVLVRAAGAEPVSEQTQPRLHNLVEGLCLTAGVSAPDIHVIRCDAPNALAVAVSPGKSAIAVTTGLLRDSDRVELEAVVAHLVARLRSGQAIAGTLTTVLIGAPVLWGELAVQRGRSSGQRASVFSGLGRALLATKVVVAPVMRMFVPAALIGEADHAACQLTRYPPALIAVLDPVVTASTVDCVSHVPDALAAMDHLWFLPAVADSESHPSVRERHMFLKEL